MKTSNRWFLALSAAGMVVTLAGCPEQGVVCREGQTACGEQCVDTVADNRNCGACGVQCGGDQVCQAGACSCPPDRAECFDSHGVCTTTQSDVAHCGACGNACAAGEVCEAGACLLECAVEGNEPCAGACVNTKTNAQHCGACGNACPQAQSCIDGACQYDLVLACFTNGQVRGVQAGTLVQGPLQDLGSAPQALARFGADTLLAIDGADDRLYQSSWPSLAERAASTTLGDTPNHVLVDGDHVYVINSSSATLQVLVKQGDAGAEGIQFATVGEHSFGSNTFPQVGVKVGTTIYVTLLGDLGAGATAGQRVVAVDVSDPTAPKPGTTWDLTGLTEPFMTGGESLPRPTGITHANGKLYVALNNSDSFYSVAGPAAVAVIPLAGGMPTAIPLPADKCRNAAWVRATGESVVVSCLGQADYSMWPTVLVGQAGVALIQNDEVKDAIEIACAEGTTTEECPDPFVGRFDIVGGRIFLGDQAAGRLYVVGLDAAAGKLTQLRTHAEGGGPLNACPVDPMSGVANIGDVLGIAAP